MLVAISNSPLCFVNLAAVRAWLSNAQPKRQKAFSINNSRVRFVEKVPPRGWPCFPVAEGRAGDGAKMRWTCSPPHFLGPGVPVPGKRHAHPSTEMRLAFNALRRGCGSSTYRPFSSSDSRKSCAAFEVRIWFQLWKAE